MIDILSKTILFFIVSAAFLLYQDVLPLLLLWVIQFVIVLFLKKARVLVLIVVFIPLLPITISHFVIEPLCADGFRSYAVGIDHLNRASIGYFRVSGLSLLSISWLWGSSFQELTSISTIVPFGRQIVLSINIVITLILMVRQRWEAVQLIQQFHTCGAWKKRRRIKIHQIPRLGLSLLIAVLASLDDYSYVAKSKVYYSEKLLAVPYPKFSLIGVLIVCLFIVFFILIDLINV